MFIILHDSYRILIITHEDGINKNDKVYTNCKMFHPSWIQNGLRNWIYEKAQTSVTLIFTAEKMEIASIHGKIVA